MLKEKLKRFHRLLGYDIMYEWDKKALKYFKEKNIIDVGCGTGRFLSLKPKSIQGIDHNNESLKHCKNQGYNVKYGKVTCLPYKNNSVNAIYSSHVIEHLTPNEAHKMLKEFDRILQVKGTIIIQTPLLYWGFYYDFTHIKPYYPQAIMHYLRTDKQQTRTFNTIPGRYKIIKLQYIRDQLFSKTQFTKLWLLFPLFNILRKLGIGIKKIGYMIVLEKIR